MIVNWQWTTFSELSPRALYQILQLRQDVFVLEQQCLYADIDDLDSVSYHLLGLNQENELIAYLRVVEPTKKYAEPSIGRVATCRSHRGKGLGKRLMQRGIAETRTRFPTEGIRISAQLYLNSFYQKFGFQTTSKPYLEDGIPHVEMLLEPITFACV